MKGEIVYVGSFKLPDRDAAAVRVSAVSDALEAAGYRVTFIGDDYTGPAASDRTRPLRERLVTATARGLNQHLTGRDAFRRLKGMDWRHVVAVIFYPGSAVLLWQLIRICRVRRIRLIVDSTEWYDPCHVILGPLGPFALESEVRMRWLHSRAGNVICVSSYLARHFEKQGCHVIRIPPLIGAGAQVSLRPVAKSTAESSGNISLVYAGFPGRKELFLEVIRALHSARQRGIDVTLRIVGPTEQQLLAITGKTGGASRVPGGIVCYGRLPRPAALKIVAQSDFTVLLRPEKRFANAGFPSKLVESLSLGVPIMGNATSDIAEYVRDGVEGIMVSSPSAAALEAAIVRATALTSEQRNRMRAQAWSRARECFDYRLYVGPLDEYIGTAQCP